MSLDAESRVPTAEAAPTDPTGTGPSPWRNRLIGAGIGLAALAFVALTRPEVITGSFGTVGSTVRVLGLLAAFAGSAWLVRRFVTNVWLARGLVWGLGAVLVLVAVVPSYRDEEVDQDLATSAADLGLDEPEPTPTTGAPTPTEAIPPAADGPAPEPAEEAPPPEPVRLTTGPLSGLAGHRGAGEAAVYELADGTTFVRLEGFDVSNGPGLELWVVPRPGAESPDGGVKLADLPGNTGSFNAAVPPGTAAGAESTVLIWCGPVATPVAHASQAPA